MARKSRKETAAVAVQEADAACRAAIYVRLSVEDPVSIIFTSIVFLALFVNSAIENPILGSIGFTVPALGAVVYLIFDRKLKKEAGENKETNDG